MSDPIPVDPIHQSPDNRRRWIPLLMLICGLAAFTLIAADVVCKGKLSQWDHPLQIRLHAFASTSVDDSDVLPPGVFFFSAVSGLGEFLFIAAIGVLVGVVLGLRKRWRALAAWALALVGSGIINPVLKNSFRVPRPSDHTFYTLHGGWSFPSGHTMAVAISAGALALVILHRVRLRPVVRSAIVAVAILLSFLEAFALMYVGVHYLTDVLGALAISLAWLGVIAWMLPPAPPLSVHGDKDVA